ncbi:PAS domain S-box-containing protein [Nitrosospira sp. Nl5]|uniref:PAS domain-containing sensor histidine kinase n=1 Tax=Nitrosospira sp. Nl5 TaxID=200120 RepID=UPI000880B758|nr:PAS domain-containing sensor histidine kinase [Nitrosospira sp. Nl5]SCY06996.1 PAS domain S-box-containing protein [Nitrosospira sp. Nl5]
MNASAYAFFNVDAALYLLDAETLRCEYANVAAQRDLQYSMAELCDLMPFDGEPGFSAEDFAPLLGSLRAGERQEVEGKTCFRRKDGSVFPVAVRLHLWRGAGKSVLIIVANDISASAEREEKREDAGEKPAQAGEGEIFSHAIVSNPAGMVFQYVQCDDGRYSMPFVGDQCVNVLGIAVETLQANPGLLLDLVLAEDRESLRQSRALSAESLSKWNWEGRLWIEAYRDVKWVSLRASPRREKDVGVIWEGIMLNITQSRRRETELLESHERLREVSSHVMAAREHERIRIAQEIHDDLGGNLTAIKIDLDWLARHIDGGGGGDGRDTTGNAMLLAKVHTIDQVVDRTIDSIRRMSRDLRPGIMDFGIVAAIEWEAKEFSKRLGIPCEIACAQQDIDLKQDVAVAVFRIFLEALTNIAKHARASRVWVRLEEVQGRLELEVRDDGGGIMAGDTAKRGSFGIRGMVERAGLLDGKLTISGERKEDRQGKRGTTVHLSIPLAGGAADPADAQSAAQRS